MKFERWDTEEHAGGASSKSSVKFKPWLGLSKYEIVYLVFTGFKLVEILYTYCIGNSWYLHNV